MISSQPRRFMGRRSFSPFRRRTRRFQWIPFASTAMIAVPGAGGDIRAILIPNANLLDLTEPTLKRIRGEILVQKVQAGAAPDFQNVAFGIEFEPTNVVAGSNEEPFSEGFSDRWLWYHFFQFQQQAAAYTGASNVLEVVRYEIDARAQRKVSRNDQLSIMGETVGGANAQNVLFAVSGRALFEQV